MAWRAFPLTRLGRPEAQGCFPSARPFYGAAEPPPIEVTPPKTSTGVLLDDPMVTLIAELARGREAIAERDLAERELRRAELGKPSERRADKALHSIFQVKPQVDMPILGDADNDVEAHLEEFEDLCNLANPRGGLMDHEKLRLFGKTLKGA